jgi:hypothetical protein
VCLLILIVLSPIALIRHQRARTSAVAKGIHVEGVRATKSLNLAVGVETLREEIRSTREKPEAIFTS